MALDMTTALTIRAKVDGLNQIDGLNKALGRSAEESKKAQTGFSGLKTALAGLTGAIASAGIGQLAKSLGEAGLEGQRIEKRIANLAGPFGETSRVMGLAANAAKQFGLSNTQAQTAIADLYGRLRPAGVALNDIGTVFNGVNKAAAAMNLTAADTDGVMLQLSQALGSGKLQGDELRSVMERLPAVGQAVAKVMGVTVGEIKQLGADGKITTDVIIKAMAELNNLKPPPPDPFKVFNAEMANLQRELGENLLPLITPVVQALAQFAQAFGKLPEPLQTFLVGATALGAALIALASAITIIGPGLAAMSGILTGLLPALAAIPALIAGWAGAIGPLVAGLGTLGQILIGVFSGPVGWVALAVAAGVAIYAFRDQIGQAFQAIGNYLTEAAKGFKMVFIDPVANAMKGLVDGIKSLFSGLAAALKAPFEAVANMIRGIVNGIIGGVERGINGAIQALNRLIAGANAALAKVGLPQIPMIPAVQLPRFAEGGVVTGPTVAMVGEGGEPEYIVPQSKAAGFAANWMAGKRGAGAIPRFADGGVVMPSTANVNIQTGPVTQMNGTNFVTTQDMSAAVRAGVQQTLDLIRRDGNVRTQLGLV